MAKYKKKSQKPQVVADNRAAHLLPNSIAALCARLNKDIGPGTIMIGEQQVPNVDFISTGIATLDAIAGGGIPRGRIVEIYGAEGSGKTTTTLEIIAACQSAYFPELKRNGVCAFVDAEHALDPSWARNIGVDMNKIMLNQPSSGEEAFKIVEAIVRSGLVDIVIVDSVAALVPREVLEGQIDDAQIGAQARLMSKGLARLKGYVNESKTSVIFINQLRTKIGVMFGNPETTPGGLALKFYASLRVDLRRGATIKVGGKDNEKPIGVVCRANIIKNKVAPPFRKCEYTLYFGHPVVPGGDPVFGADKIGCLFDAGLTYKVIGLSGSTYYFDGQNIGNGREKSVAAIVANHDLATKLRLAILVAATPVKGTDLTQVDDDELDDNLADVAEVGEDTAADQIADPAAELEDDLTTSARDN